MRVKGRSAVRVRSVMKMPACVLAFLLCPGGPAGAEDAKIAYPSEAPIEQYRIANASEEIELARSAAPDSISGNATILVLGAHGYDTAIQGKNGFVCLVERSWANEFQDGEFWNPKIRTPNCFNAAAVSSVLPSYFKRTEWAMAGVSKADMIDRYKAELSTKGASSPEPGAMSYMMSKRTYINDGTGHWHPHVMFFLARVDAAAWGANAKGSPIFGGQAAEDPFTTFYVIVPAWSDGTPAAMKMP